MVGERFTINVADGRAEYEVVEVVEATIPGSATLPLARVRHVVEEEWQAEYVSPVLGTECWIEAESISHLVAYTANLARIFGRREE